MNLFGQMRLMNRGPSIPLGGTPSFWLPLIDKGSGEVDLTLALGSGSATFTRATVATCRLADGTLKKVAAGVPRSHYAADGTYLGYLAEGQRTNSLLASADFSASGWTTALGCTVTAGTGTAPDGTASLNTVNFSDIAGNRLEQSLTAAAADGEVWTFSLWLSGSGTINISVNTSTGVGGETEVTIALTSVPTRYEVTVTLSSPTGNPRGMLIRRDSNTATSCQAWGAQLEAGSFASSYIPTTDAAVTRDADVLNYGDTQNNGTNDFSVFAEVNLYDVSGAQEIFTKRGTGTLGTNKGWGIRSVDGVVGVEYDDGSTGYAVGDLGGDLSSGVSSRIGMSVDRSADKITGVQDGEVGAPLTSIDLGGDITHSENELSVMYHPDSASLQHAFGTIKNVKIFGRALSDAQLQALTS